MRAILAFILLGALLIFSIALLYLQLQDGRLINSQNQGYVRYLACVTDIRNEKGVLTVSDEISDACWQQAEKETGVKLPRYSEKLLLEKL